MNSKINLISFVIFGLTVSINSIMAQCTGNLIGNGSFEGTTCVCISTYLEPFPNLFWHTTASDHYVELWHAPCNGVNAEDGTQFCELQASQCATNYQHFSTACIAQVSWSFWHRGRASATINDSMELQMGPIGGPYTSLVIAADNNTAWNHYSGTYDVPLCQDSTVINFVCISSANNSPSIGNFYDNVCVLPTILRQVTFNSSVSYQNCTGDITINNAAGGCSPYHYSNNGGSTYQTDSIFNQLTGGTYSVIVMDSSGCTDTTTQTITSFNVPIPVITGGDSLCPGGSLTLSTGTFNNYQWSNGTTTQSTTVTTGGTYIVTVSDTVGCTATASQVVTDFNSIPTIAGDTSICAGNSTTLDAGTFSTYTWSNGATNETITVNTASSYSVTVTNSIGCTGTATISVVVHPNAIASFTPDSMLGCVPFTVIFSNSSTNAASYFWNFGDNNTSTSTIPSNTYTLAGNYTVTLIAYGAGGCNDTLQKSFISVINPPNVTTNFTADTLKGCTPLTVIFTNTSSGGTNYIWTFGDGDTSYSFNATHTFLDSGLFTIKLITINDTSICGIYSDSLIETQYIAVADPVKITASFTASPLSGCTPLLVNLINNTTGGTSYYWSFGDSTGSIIQNPNEAIYLNSGIYKLTLISYNINDRCYNPPDTMSISITVDSCYLFIPNVFSPNGDGMNDNYELIADGYSKYHLIIFDRWGLKVFESTSNGIYWNGTINNTGGKCPDGTYYYIFSAVDIFNSPLNEKGYITLIR